MIDYMITFDGSLIITEDSAVPCPEDTDRRRVPTSRSADLPTDA